MKKLIHAFTLIEFLTVIATVAILAALLLPILTKAKIKAERKALVTCTTPMVRAITSSSTNHTAPIQLTNGWYYIRGQTTNVIRAVHLMRQADPGSITILAYEIGDTNVYKSRNVVVADEVIRRAGLTNGTILVRKCGQTNRPTALNYD